MISLLLEDNRDSLKILLVSTVYLTSLDDLKNLSKKTSDTIEGAFSCASNKDSISSESATFKMNRSEYEQICIK